MEPARPRADQNFFGPRAGRLQDSQLHFAIWHIYHRSTTARLFSLQRALINDGRFLLRRNAKRFYVNSGNALPLGTAGGWVTTFLCPITYIFLLGQKLALDVWQIGYRCGRA